jgi:hypothetical protein
MADGKDNKEGSRRREEGDGRREPASVFSIANRYGRADQFPSLSEGASSESSVGSLHVRWGWLGIWSGFREPIQSAIQTVETGSQFQIPRFHD